MSWNSSHSVGWTDATISTFIGWVQRPKFSKETIGWTDGIGSGSSDALGFGNSKGQSSASSKPDDPTLWPAVYPTLAFKSYRDAPKHLLQRRMNRRFRSNPAVHPTPAFKLHSTATSGCCSAPDDPTGRRYIDWVTWFNGYFSTCEWPDDPTLAQGEPSVNQTVLFFRETFPMASFPW
jgi:hypothetical protein